MLNYITIYNCCGDVIDSGIGTHILDKYDLITLCDVCGHPVYRAKHSVMWKVWMDNSFVEGEFTLDEASDMLAGYVLYLGYTDRYQYRGGYNSEGKYAFIQPVGV